MRTLVIDIGGTGIKAGVLDPSGAGAPVRVPTPRPATPAAVVDAIGAVAVDLPFDRVSVGFPGVVVDGIVQTAPNLDDGWSGFDLARAVEQLLGKPVRVLNDAGMHGLGVIKGHGTEVVVTLGTGMGFGLYIDGRYVPNVELAHHPLQDGLSYEELVCDAELARVGPEAWKARVRGAIDQMRHTFNFRVLYLGGGNARWFTPEECPADAVLVDNSAALLGGVRIWGPQAAPSSVGVPR